MNTTPNQKPEVKLKTEDKKIIKTSCKHKRELLYSTTTTTAAAANNNNNNNNNNHNHHIKDKHSSSINSDPSHCLAHASNNSFLNIQLKFSTTTKEIESIIKPLNPKNTCEYDEISINYLKSALFIFPRL
jgi:hypothetical protein